MSGGHGDAVARATFVQARRDHLPAYAAMAQEALRSPRERVPGQRAPAPHRAHAATLARLVRHGELHASLVDAAPVAFFAVTRCPGTCWPPDAVDAFYLARVVVAPAWRGRGLGRAIVEWSAAQAAAQGASVLRLDGRDGDERLGGFYASLGFRVVGRATTLGNDAPALRERALRAPCSTCRFTVSSGSDPARHPGRA